MLLNLGVIVNEEQPSQIYCGTLEMHHLENE